MQLHNTLLLNKIQQYRRVKVKKEVLLSNFNVQRNIHIIFELLKTWHRRE